MGNDSTLTGDKVADFDIRQQAMGRAQADPLPGPLTEAFTKDALRVGSILIRKFVMRDFRTLKALDHPLLEVMRELQQTGKTTVELDEGAVMDLAYIFSNQPKAMFEQAQAGKEAFRTSAEEWFLDRISTADLTVICGCVMEQLSRTWKTAIHHTQELEKDNAVTFFRDAAKATEMASVGGSTTAVGS